MHQLVTIMLAYFVVASVGAQQLEAKLITKEQWSMQCDTSLSSIASTAFSKTAGIEVMASGKGRHWMGYCVWDVGSTCATRG